MEALIQSNIYCNFKFGQNFELLLIDNTLYSKKNLWFLLFWINHVQPVNVYVR